MKSELSITLTSEKKVTFTEVGIVFHRELSGQEWVNLWTEIDRANNGLQWAIADWLNYGQRNNYGDKYGVQIRETGLKYKTLVNIAAIGRAYEFAQRFRHPITFSHHRLVVAMHPDARRAWLIKAEQNEWSYTQLEQALAGDANGKVMLTSSPNGFIFDRWIGEGYRWFRAELDRIPISDRPTEWRQEI